VRWTLRHPASGMRIAPLRHASCMLRHPIYRSPLTASIARQTFEMKDLLHYIESALPFKFYVSFRVILDLPK